LDKRSDGGGCVAYYLSAHFFSKVWMDIARWLGVEASLPNVRVVHHLVNFSGLIHSMV